MTAARREGCAILSTCTSFCASIVERKTGSKGGMPRLVNNWRRLLVTPGLAGSRPGLARVGYRPGTYAEFKATLLARLSRLMTLVPGDIVSTGTPAGVGSTRKPRVWLKPGDEMVVSSPVLGELTTRVAD